MLATDSKCKQVKDCETFYCKICKTRHVFTFCERKSSISDTGKIVLPAYHWICGNVIYPALNEVKLYKGGDKR